MHHCFELVAARILQAGPGSQHVLPNHACPIRNCFLGTFSLHLLYLNCICTDNVIGRMFAIPARAAVSTAPQQKGVVYEILHSCSEYVLPNHACPIQNCDAVYLQFTLVVFDLLSFYHILFCRFFPTLFGTGMVLDCHCLSRHAIHVC